ncbi:uncharacterized protein [Populus alba]|uniref:uncharacterized protein n=1 Tax=Populus alba TaxID=43335 RepID=UPI003CC75EA7
MVSELAMESLATSILSPAAALSLDFTPSKTHLPDISTKLASNNYLLWKAQVVPILRGHGLIGYVTDGVPCPELTIVDADGTSSLEDYLHGAKSLALSLRGVGKPMDDDDLIICILRGLGSEFDPIVAALNARDMFPPLEGVIGKLRDFEIRLQGTRTSQSSVAFYTNKNRFHARSQGNHNACGRSGGYHKMPFQPRNKDVRFSHPIDNSSGAKLSSFTRGSRTSSRGRGNLTCFRCGFPNHKVDGCFASDKEAKQYNAFAAIQIGDTTEDTWYPDTGAN